MKRDKSEQTRLEQEAGARKVRLYKLLQQVHDEEIKLQKAFNKVTVKSIILHPYTHVRVTVSRGPDLLLQEEDPVGTFPSDELVTKIALIA